MMLFENYPLEKYIVAKLKECNYRVEETTNAVFTKYPFFRKRELKEIISKVLEKVAASKGVNGFWVKVGKDWELISKNKVRALYLPDDDNTPAEVGRANREFIAPKGRPVDRYEPPKKDDKSELEEAQSIYNRMHEKYKKELADLEPENLNKVLLEELATMGYGEEDIKNLKLK